jgi:small-conductance mechanosensitive channel
MFFAAVEISESVQRALDDLFAFLPKLIGFLIILVIGFLIAKALQKLVALALEKAGTDKAVRSGPSGEHVRRIAPDVSPSHAIGKVVFWFVFLVAIAIGAGSLGIETLNEFMASVINYLPNVIAAILIFVLAVAIAGALAKLIERTMGDTPMGKLMSTAVPALVLGIAVFMILNQLKIAPDIVVITYACLMGAVALGAALAFGLGGRDVASRMLEDAYRRGQAERARSSSGSSGSAATTGAAPAGPGTTGAAPSQEGPR